MTEYRQYLSRDLNPLFVLNNAVMFCMLNPSKAESTGTKNDNTIRKCMAFARLWGYGRLYVGNIFAYRSTDPANLYKAAEPVGRGNNEAIMDMAYKSKLIIAAWGNHGQYHGRGATVLRMLQDANQVHCLGITMLGQPRHPLYVPNGYKPIRLMDIGKVHR